MENGIYVSRNMINLIRKSIFSRIYDTLTIQFNDNNIIENSNQQETIDRIKVLETEIMQLRKENETLQKKCVEIVEEANKDKFKCQLLLEMVRLSYFTFTSLKMTKDIVIYVYYDVACC